MIQFPALGAPRAGWSTLRMNSGANCPLAGLKDSLYFLRTAIFPNRRFFLNRFDKGCFIYARPRSRLTPGGLVCNECSRGRRTLPHLRERVPRGGPPKGSVRMLCTAGLTSVRDERSWQSSNPSRVLQKIIRTQGKRFC